MREHLHVASARRDDRLARIRKLTLWIGGGAAAASLGLGTAFAHALPGHAASSQARSPGASAGAPGGGSGGTAGGTGGTGTGTGKPVRHHHDKLARPQQPPVHTSAPPVVTSGGS